MTQTTSDDDPLSISSSSDFSESYEFPASIKAENTTDIPTDDTSPPLENDDSTNYDATASPARKLAGYYPVYNTDEKSLSELRFDLYDEIIFFAATTTDNFTIGTDYFTQAEWDAMAFDFVKSCKEHSVIPTYALGGWGGSRYFSSLVATADNRTAFADAVITFAKKYGFEGVDFDWEYAGIQGIGCNIISDQDAQNQQMLFKEVKSRWPEGKLSTTQSIAGIRDPDYQQLPASNTTMMVEAIDNLRIMAYDVHGSFTATTGPNAPIRSQCADPENQLSIEGAIEIYIKQGFKPEQISLGIPGYAISWSLAKPELAPRIVGNYTSYYYQNFTGIPRGGKFDEKPGLDSCGQPTGYGGQWNAHELVESGFLSDDEASGGNGYTRYHDACSGEPFIASNTTLISYDDAESTVSKVKFANSKGLGGVFFFDTMGPRDSTVKAARKAMLN
ncbi:hypothetical protein PtA15_5A51 [Puccinia triticina]|uniref:GH18 domain-containing protein n=1 Tax=Puccinia triticina TaxID=208348 RepID=A0ABY7CGY6_9BASI|nr:uncharacterized protein PtA15_5A51 [Puccinia triticina]WAQ84481.1 hypothetical protein PtA15_5A51 [Puccinia triticina]